MSSADGFFGEHSMAGKLKPLDVERETKPGKYADGEGLYLIVTGADAKNWSFRYWFEGKERWHGLSSDFYPHWHVSILEEPTRPWLCSSDQCRRA